MGAYCSYFYNGLYIDSSKNDIDISILNIIENSDIHTIPYKDAPEYIKSHFDIKGMEDEDECFYTLMKIDKQILLDRLKIKGYSFDFSKEMFEMFLKQKIEEYEQPEYDFMKKELKILKTISFEKWLENIKFIQKNELDRFSYADEYEDTDPLLHYMLTHDWYGFQGYDICIFLRLLLEISEEGEFFGDLTDLVLSEYIDVDDIDDMKIRYFKSDKIIVLTEGKSDIKILSRTLKLLYPHLYTYFAFMDFDNAKIGGGVGPLTSIVKSFAGVGISNKIIAIFDNDTAAKSATKQLDRIELPPNIKIMFLPEIKRLNNYPTLGPTGQNNMNINSIAGSIEMYLGHNALFDNTSQTYYPVQWKGYDTGQGKYQGEVIEKDIIQQNYFEILDKCENDPSQISKYDFGDIQLILENLFNIFSKYEQKLMIEEKEKYE